MATTTHYGWTTPDDTDLVKNGASAIRSLGSSVDTALWNAGFTAGKNKIINGDFGVWQRGTSFSLGSNTAAYTADRFYAYAPTGSAMTVSQQTFTAGTAPVAGYEGTYFLRQTITTASSGQSWSNEQRIESVRTFAGQTVTFSFWAKAAANTTIGAGYRQYFGSGGSANVTADFSSSISLTTSWQRFSFTLTLPNISGKTIGAGDYFTPYIYGSTTATSTVDTWGWQLEAGSVATPFQTATGTKQGELAACQRYYWRWTATVTYSVTTFVGFTFSTSQIHAMIKPPTTMRSFPSLIEASSGFRFTEYKATYNDLNSSTIGLVGSTEAGNGDGWFIVASAASGTPFTTGRTGVITASNNASAYIGFGAEL